MFSPALLVAGEVAELGGVVVGGASTKSDPSGHVPSSLNVMVVATSFRQFPGFLRRIWPSQLRRWCRMAATQSKEVVSVLASSRRWVRPVSVTRQRLFQPFTFFQTLAVKHHDSDPCRAIVTTETLGGLILVRVLRLLLIYSGCIWLNVVRAAPSLASMSLFVLALDSI